MYKNLKSVTKPMKNLNNNINKLLSLSVLDFPSNYKNEFIGQTDKHNGNIRYLYLCIET